MSWGPVILAVISVSAVAQESAGVRSYEGELTIPTYTHSGRETEPPLFANSSVAGMYPFTTYLMPFPDGGAAPKTYHAVFVENEYLKLTYLPDLGGRFFSLYDKLRGREVFYRNDTIKPASYNPRNSWPISGLELTGPHDLHMLTLHGEPFWSHSIQRRPDGAVSLVLGEYDPVYRMRVSLTATLYPGVAAMEVSVFAHNPHAVRMPQMFWLSAGVAATPKLRFIYPMTRTVGHTTSDIADWPVHNGIDYSWDRNNRNMLGVFGIDIYDDFQGAYAFDKDFGVFRYADRRIVQGMKMWTFGYGPSAKLYEQGYTDKAGPYIEVQSGRHVWDGHYEWVEPHKTESWSEWWIPVSGTGGVTTLTKDVALNLEAQASSLSVVLGAMRVVRNANLTVRSRLGEALNTRIDLDPAKPFRISIPIGDMEGISVLVSDADGRVLLYYRRPVADPAKKEYTPFTRPLEEAAEIHGQNERRGTGAWSGIRSEESQLASTAQALIDKALVLDPEYSRAHILLGIHHFTEGRYATAAGHLEKAISRDPYSDEAHYYLAMSRFALGDSVRAARQLYFIWPGSAFFGAREYFLGRQELIAGEMTKAAAHLEQAVAYGGRDLSARLLMAVVQRELKQQAGAMEQIAAVEKLDPNNPVVWAERFFLTGDGAAKRELARLMGGQGQEGLNVSSFYRDLGRWKEAVEILRTVDEQNKDVWGTAPEFYYVQAYCLRRAGDATAADAALRKARASAGKVDRFPYREDSEAALTEAVSLDAKDAVARFALGCLLYFGIAQRRPSHNGSRRWHRLRQTSRCCARSAWPTPVPERRLKNPRKGLRVQWPLTPHTCLHGTISAPCMALPAGSASSAACWRRPCREGRATTCSRRACSRLC